jgi:hypothetical protein
VYVAICTEFRDAVEDIFEQSAATMAQATEIAASEIARDSRENKLYRKYGVEIVDDVLDWVLENRIRDEERVRKRLANQFGSWLLKVAAKDTNMQNVGKLPPHHAKAF